MRKEHWLLISVIVVIALWVLTPSLVNLFAPINKEAIAERGQFGDMYGFITSLFSGLTIIGLVYTIIQQQDDLRIAREAYNQQRIDAQTNIEALDLARQEMELTKIAVDQSAAELKKQSRQLAYQRFENTFFNLINLSNEIIKNLPHQRSTFIAVSASLQNNDFHYAKTYEELHTLYFKKETGKNGHSMADNIEDIFGHYLKNFEQIIYYIYEKKKSEKISSAYYNFYFSQIGNYERVILLFHFALMKNQPEPLKDCQHILFMPLEKSMKILRHHYSALYDHLVEIFYE